MQESSTASSHEGDADDELHTLGPGDGDTEIAGDGNAELPPDQGAAESEEPRAQPEQPELPAPRGTLALDSERDIVEAPDRQAPDRQAPDMTSLDEPASSTAAEQRAQALSAAPTWNTSVADEPLADEPLADESLADESLADESLADESLADEPLADEPPSQDQSRRADVSDTSGGDSMPQSSRDSGPGSPSEAAQVLFEPTADESGVTEPIPEPAYDAYSREGEENLSSGFAGEPVVGSVAEPPALVAQTPWNLRQTVVGTVLTLGPWLVFALGSQLAQRGSPAPIPAHRLAPSVDLIQALLLFIVSSALEGIFLIAPLYYAMHTLPPSITGRSRWPMALRALGLRLPNPALALRAAVVGILVILGASVVYNSIITTLHLPLKTNVDTLMQQAKYAPYTVIGTLLVAVLVAPLCEEMFFRGYLFPGLARGMQLWLAVFISAVLFGVAHADLGSFVVLFVIGIVLAVVRARTDSLWPGVAVHTLNNTIAFISILVLLR